jgi:hypothetical protein
MSAKPDLPGLLDEITQPRLRVVAPPGADLSLLKHFAGLEDPRVQRTRRHELPAILLIAFCAVLGGAETPSLPSRPSATPSSTGSTAS